MFYAWDITIPAGRAVTNPVEQILKLSKGVITKCDLTFPSGCHGLVKVRIKHREHQLIPLSSDEWVIGDGETVPTEAHYELDKSPYQLKFIGCSPTTIYDHKITVRVQVLLIEEVTSTSILEAINNIGEAIGI
jgi:hypothetical protein